MYKRQQALCELNELGGSQDISSFEDIFMISKLKNDIENNEDTNNKEGGANSGYSASYTNDYMNFKKEMLNASLLYMEFWTMLMTEGDENANKINKLNDLGSQISGKVEDIENKFTKLRKINKNNHEILYFYSEFLKNILNKTSQAEKFKEEYDKIYALQNSEKDKTFQNEPFYEFKRCELTFYHQFQKQIHINI